MHPRWWVRCLSRSYLKSIHGLGLHCLHPPVHHCRCGRMPRESRHTPYHHCSSWTRHPCLTGWNIQIVFSDIQCHKVRQSGAWAKLRLLQFVTEQQLSIISKTYDISQWLPLSFANLRNHPKLCSPLFPWTSHLWLHRQWPSPVALRVSIPWAEWREMRRWRRRCCLLWCLGKRNFQIKSPQFTANAINTDNILKASYQFWRVDCTCMCQTFSQHILSTRSIPQKTKTFQHEAKGLVASLVALGLSSLTMASESCSMLGLSKISRGLMSFPGNSRRSSKLSFFGKRLLFFFCGENGVSSNHFEGS